ncbi:MAG TPA: hypothetical protein VG778_02100 [Blastocatellia bacterium]|jgi:hypothetical protein|nr:hypothetical protein [Blastocatellia bacterium]
MASEETTAGAASGAIWALATLLIVLIVLAILYFGGAFQSKKQIDINIDKPGLVLLRSV